MSPVKMKGGEIIAMGSVAWIESESLQKGICMDSANVDYTKIYSYLWKSTLYSQTEKPGQSKDRWNCTAVHDSWCLTYLSLEQSSKP